MRHSPAISVAAPEVPTGSRVACLAGLPVELRSLHIVALNPPPECVERSEIATTEGRFDIAGGFEDLARFVEILRNNAPVSKEDPQRNTTARCLSCCRRAREGAGPRASGRKGCALDVAACTSNSDVSDSGNAHAGSGGEPMQARARAAIQASEAVRGPAVTSHGRQRDERRLPAIRLRSVADLSGAVLAPAIPLALRSPRAVGGEACTHLDHIRQPGHLDRHVRLGGGCRRGSQLPERIVAWPDRKILTLCKLAPNQAMFEERSLVGARSSRQASVLG